MAKNEIHYEGTVIRKRMPDGSHEPIPFARTESGLYILGPFTLSERHDQKVSRIRQQPKLAHILEDERNIGKGDDDYVTVATSWHRVKVVGDKAEELAQEAWFGRGALVKVVASYEEDASPFTGNDGITRVGRSESIGDKFGSIEMVFEPKEPQEPIWDGISEVAPPRRFTRQVAPDDESPF